MTFTEILKQQLPEAAKDTKLNLDAVLLRSSLELDVAIGCALAAAIATGNSQLVALISADKPIYLTAATTAAALMAQNNIWYPYVDMTEDPNLKQLPPQLRMNSIASHGGTTKANFEAFSLSASIIGRCHFCVKAHYEALKTEQYTVQQLRDIGRIASVINSVAKVWTSSH